VAALCSFIRLHQMSAATRPAVRRSHSPANYYYLFIPATITIRIGTRGATGADRRQAQQQRQPRRLISQIQRWGACMCGWNPSALPRPKQPLVSPRRTVRRRPGPRTLIVRRHLRARLWCKGWRPALPHSPKTPPPTPPVSFCPPRRRTGTSDTATACNVSGACQPVHAGRCVTSQIILPSIRIRRHPVQKETPGVPRGSGTARPARAGARLGQSRVIESCIRIRPIPGTARSPILFTRALLPTRDPGRILVRSAT
jgi:hypothetical protein